MSIGPRFQPLIIMNPTAQLTGSHLRTYECIVRHPVAHNLEWRDVHALFRQIGRVEEESNGSLKVTRNGQTIVLQPSRTKDVSTTDEVMALRHFLERSATPEAGTKGKEAQWVVVIDHREARIYRSAEAGAVPQQIRPPAPENFFRHPPHSQDFSRGQEKPDPSSFFEPVAGVLNGAGKILIFGGGTGTSSEMDQFVMWLKQRRPELAQRIVGTEVIDEHHLTEPQLLAKARRFYADMRAAR